MKDNLVHIALFFLVFSFATILIIGIFEDSPKFGTAVCKESHHSMGVCSRFGCTGSNTDYYLIDENSIQLEVTKKIYDALALPECKEAQQ